MKQTEKIRAERKRVPVGATVRHRRGGMTGRVVRYASPSVGAPSMARVAWASGSTSVIPTSHLEVVA